MKTFKSPLVIGYKGEIGSFILQGLLRIMPKASNIWCYDVNDTEEEKQERIKKADVIFLCVPMQDTLKWFDKYNELLKDKTVIEQCSLKSDICNKINNENFKLLSMHILFRPSKTPNIEDRTVSCISNPRWNSKLTSTIKQLTVAKITWFDSYEQHDEVMGIQQALTHRIILVLHDMIVENCTGYQQTYMTKRILELSARIMSGDATLYKMIQDNKYLPDILEEFNDRLTNFSIGEVI